jgi:hypothetical protein
VIGGEQLVTRLVLAANDDIAAGLLIQSMLTCSSGSVVLVLKDSDLALCVLDPKNLVNFACSSAPCKLFSFGAEFL